MSDLIKVKASTLRLVYSSLAPLRYKMSSILEDVFSKRITISDPHKALLLEFSAHAYTLKLLLEEYFEGTTEKGEIEIPRDDFTLIINIAKSVEAAGRADFGNIALWDN